MLLSVTFFGDFNFRHRLIVVSTHLDFYSTWKSSSKVAVWKCCFDCISFSPDTSLHKMHWLITTTWFSSNQSRVNQHHSIHHVVSSRSARCVWKQIGVWWISLQAVPPKGNHPIWRNSSLEWVVHDGLIKRFHSAEQRKSYNRWLPIATPSDSTAAAERTQGEPAEENLFLVRQRFSLYVGTVSIQLAVIARSYVQSDVFGFGSWYSWKKTLQNIGHRKE